jgi:Lysozyme inhibitor LprI
VTVKNRYVLAGVDAATEAGRLALLEQRFDTGTIRRLGDLGVRSGWRCLEVGAGHGSIARWLSDKVGPAGSVVAADIDARFLTGLPDNVDVCAGRVHDALSRIPGASPPAKSRCCSASMCARPLAGRPLVIAAHKAWLAYRRAYCLSLSDVFQGGSQAPVLDAQCAGGLNGQHIKDLRQFASDVGAG